MVRRRAESQAAVQASHATDNADRTGLLRHIQKDATAVHAHGATGCVSLLGGPCEVCVGPREPGAAAHRASAQPVCYGTKCIASKLQTKITRKAWATPRRTRAPGVRVACRAIWICGAVLGLGVPGAVSCGACARPRPGATGRVVRPGGPSTRPSATVKGEATSVKNEKFRSVNPG